MLKTLPQRIDEIETPIRAVSAHVAAAECASNRGILIDVREPDEYRQEGVSQATNIPRGLLEIKVPEKFRDANQPIYLHCASGIRAKLAAEQLARMGYENITVITCSIIDICKHFDGE